MLGSDGKILMALLSTQIYGLKTPVLAIFLKYQGQVWWYYTQRPISQLNLALSRRPNWHISLNLRVDSFSGLEIFFACIFTSNCHEDIMMTPLQQASSWSWRRTIDDAMMAPWWQDRKPTMINHHLVVFKQNDPGELRGL